LLHRVEPAAGEGVEEILAGPGQELPGFGRIFGHPFAVAVQQRHVGTPPSVPFLARLPIESKRFEIILLRFRQLLFQDAEIDAASHDSALSAGPIVEKIGFGRILFDPVAMFVHIAEIDAGLFVVQLLAGSSIAFESLFQVFPYSFSPEIEVALSIAPLSHAVIAGPIVE
jgi:hypothetical protein